MTDLFDLPFEEDAPEPEGDGQQSPGDLSARLKPRVPSVPVEREASAERFVGSSTVDRRLSTPRVALTVTELTVRVRDLLEGELFEVWVEGELSNCKIWKTGHLYFTLKDSATQLRGFMFRSSLRYLKFKPADGQRVVARGKITVYEPKGEYQLVCEHLEPHGLGALQLAFDQLKKQLQAEGLFDAARKRPLPALPRKIGIVTSLDGAAIRDIIKVLRRRYPNVHLIIQPARVQGEDAAIEIARGLRLISRVPGVDVVIVGRGGGSMEDLWAFNEERVARAIARMPMPVISAVGHETDTTIADFVADVRAPTPSAAAEIVVSRKDEFCNRIDSLRDRARIAAHRRAQASSRRVHIVTGRPAFAGFPGHLAMRGRHVSELTHALTRIGRAAIAIRARQLQQWHGQLTMFDVGRRLAGIRTRLVAAEGRLIGSAARRTDRAKARIQHAAGRLDSLSPLAVLARGYAVCWNDDRTRVIRDAATVEPGDGVTIRLDKGELACEVRAKGTTTDITDTNGGTRTT